MFSSIGAVVGLAFFGRAFAWQGHDAPCRCSSFRGEGLIRGADYDSGFRAQCSGPQALGFKDTQVSKS